MKTVVLIAPNAFKNACTSYEAAQACKDGLENSYLNAECILNPIADGGDGTLDTLLAVKNGYKTFYTVHDPLNRVIQAPLGWVNNHRTAILEMAEVSGLKLLSPDEYDAGKTSTYGLGELINEALKAGAGELLIGVGGSATVDAGMGMLAALGARFYDADGELLYPCGKNLAFINQIDWNAFTFPSSSLSIKILCDVTTCFMDAPGVFGPQKGAGPAMVTHLEKGFTNFSNHIDTSFSPGLNTIKHGGAAGGIAATISAVLKGVPVSGTHYILEKTSFYESLNKCHYVITGEGKIDESTKNDKGPWYIIQKAADINKPVILVCGQYDPAFNHSNFTNIRGIFSIKKNKTKQIDLNNTTNDLKTVVKEIGDKIYFKSL